MTGQSTAENRLVAQNLTVTMSGRTLVTTPEFVLPRGRIVAIVGANGAGKSTLLRAVAGLIEPATEAVRIVEDGAARSLAAMSPRDRARSIGWVPARTDAPFAYTVRDAAMIGRFPWHGGRPGPADARRVDQALAELGLSSLAARTLPSLSSGELQKAMLARAVAGDTPYLLLDEPTATLDVAAALALLRLLRALAEAGRGIALAIHDLALAMRYADDAVVLRGGEMVAAGDVGSTMTPAIIEQAFGVRLEFARLPDETAAPVFRPF